MSKADDIYKDLILDIYENGLWDTKGDVRTKYEDNLPAYTKSVFGKQVIFEEGEIPLLTTKHVGWKTAFKEMYLFWIQQTVKKEDFDNLNVRVWDEWFLANDTLGKSYAYQFESRPKKEVIKVKRKLKNKHGEISTIKINDLLPHNINCKDEICGKIFESKTSGKFKVLDVIDGSKEYHYIKMCDIQFIETGYKRKVQKQQITSDCKVKDYFHRTVNDVGYVGEWFKNNFFTDEQQQILHKKWVGMIERCYSNSSKTYKNHGGKGVFVDERWHCYANFLNDIILLPNFFIAKQDGFKGWTIDKDYYGSNCYSADTCVFLHKTENVIYQINNKPFYIIDSNGNKSLYISITDAIKNNGVLSEASISRLVCGQKKEIKGYTVEKIKDDNYVYRYKLSQNQVVNLINNIKNTPLSRRLMTSFWNDSDVYEKALQECAMQTTWNVRDGKLDLLLYSRSVDAALGLPFNWIQYWCLLQLVSKATGYKAGRFIHQMGNVHYYDRHEELLLKQINNNTYEQPKFNITNEEKDFFSFALDDISIEDYKNGGKFEYEVAI